MAKVIDKAPAKSRQTPVAEAAAAVTGQVSATNMVEKRPRDRKGSADQKGAPGRALAAVFITAAETLGRAIDAIRITRKEKLEQVLKLDPNSLRAFHKAMMDRMEAVTAQCAEEKKTNPLVKGLREFFELHPGMETVYVETSMWKKLALAIDANWKPERDSVGAITMTWPNLTAAATAHLEARGKPSNDPANPQPVGSTKRTAGRAPTTPQAKAVNAVTNALKNDKGEKLAKNNRNLTAVIEGILDADGGATLEELTEIGAMLMRKLEAAKKAKDAADAALVKAAAPATQGKEKLADNQSKTHNGATVTKTEAKGRRVPSADELVETGKAIASSGKRARAKA